MSKLEFRAIPNSTCSMSQKQCQYVLTKGVNEGTRCPTLIKEGDFCAVCIKKKGAKVLSENSIIIKERLNRLDDTLWNLSIETDDLILEPESMDEACKQMHIAMKNRIVAKEIMKIGEGMYEIAGTRLQRIGEELEMNLNVLPGQASEPYTDDVFSFRKRLANEPNKVDWNKFQKELKKLGVSDEVVISALTASTSKGSPAQYLEVTTV